MVALIGRPKKDKDPRDFTIKIAIEIEKNELPQFGLFDEIFHHPSLQFFKGGLPSGLIRSAIQFNCDVYFFEMEQACCQQD